MKQKLINKIQPSGAQMPEIDKVQELVKASHLSSSPINDISNYGTAHFEVEVGNAFFRVFFSR